MDSFAIGCCSVADASRMFVVWHGAIWAVMFILQFACYGCGEESALGPAFQCAIGHHVGRLGESRSDHSLLASKTFEN